MERQSTDKSIVTVIDDTENKGQGLVIKFNLASNFPSGMVTLGSSSQDKVYCYLISS